MDENTDPLWFKPKERPKTTSQEKNSNFWYRHSFFMKFFCLKDEHHRKVLWAKFCIWCRSPLRYEKQNEMAMIHFDNVALLLVPGHWEASDTKFSPTILSCDAHLSNKKISRKNSACSKSYNFSPETWFWVSLLAWITVDQCFIHDPSSKKIISLWKTKIFPRNFFIG